MAHSVIEITFLKKQATPVKKPGLPNFLNSGRKESGTGVKE